jgi:hypothetical protein
LTPPRRSRRRADTDEAKRRAWLAQELEDGATAGLILNYVKLHADLAEQLQQAREAFALPASGIGGGSVGGSREPDRAVARCLPDWPDEVMVNATSHGTRWPAELPDQNTEAVKLERIRTYDHIRLAKLAGDYDDLLRGDLDGVAGWPLHPRLHTWIGEQTHDPATTDLLWSCLQVHRLLASLAKGGTDHIVKRRKAMEARWRYLIEALERDMGRRPREKGRRNLRGRPVVEYVGEDDVRRFG